MIDKTIVKLGIVAAMLTMLIGFWQWDRNRAYQGGYDAGKAEQLAVMIQADKAFAEKLKEVVLVRDHWRQVAIDLQNMPPKTITVIKYVDKIIEKNPDCTVIHGISELWNTARESYINDFGGSNP